MSVNQKYEIQQMFLQGVPQISYQDGVGNYRGVCAHETANWGSGESEDTVLGERNWEQQDWQNAFVHFFVDYQTVLNVAPLEYISWGCCSLGNPLFVNVELCRTKDPERFAQSYDRWTWIMAKILFERKLGVSDGGSFVSHKWVSDNLEGTHQDPIEYLTSHGKSWQDCVNDVTAYYNQFEIESGITPINTNPMEDEENMAMNLSEDQWQRLNNVVGQWYNAEIISDWNWLVKIHTRTMTASELALLHTFVNAKKDGLSIEPNSYGME